MTAALRWLTALCACIAVPVASAQSNGSSVPAQPVVGVSASASAPLANDRMHASMRVEVDNADAAAAANEVNAKMAKALARAKAVKGVEAETTAYSSYQVNERNQPMRWRVSQTLSLEGSDFTALAALVSKIQSEDGLVLSGMNFQVSPAARRAAEDSLTEQAIKAWQARAQIAARAFGATSWRPGHVTIQTGDVARPLPMYRASSVAAVLLAAPIATESGTTDITVTVTGDAILDGASK